MRRFIKQPCCGNDQVTKKEPGELMYCVKCRNPFVAPELDGTFVHMKPVEGPRAEVEMPCCGHRQKTRAPPGGIVYCTKCKKGVKRAIA